MGVMVNAILNPTPSYFNPLTNAHSQTYLDLGLESLYSLESLGINEDSDQGSIDQAFISKFLSTIEFKEEKYNVELPWYEDILDTVPSNNKVALAMLHRVSSNLENKGLTSVYRDIFRKYEEDGII